MTEEQDQPSDETQKREVSEAVKDQATNEIEDSVFDEPDADDSPELRLQVLSAEYARERAALAEQISQLQEENDRLTQRLQALECADAKQTVLADISEDEAHPERALGLDFSLPEEQSKG